MSGKKIKLRPLRIIGYLVLYGLNLGLYFILRSYFLWLTAIVLTVAPIFSIAAACSFARKIQLSVVSEEEKIRQGETCFLDIVLENSLWYGIALECGTVWEITNSFYGDSSDLSISMPVERKGKSILRLPLRGEKLGRICFQCKKIVLLDMLGLVRWEGKAEAVQELFILPKEQEEILEENTEYGSGMTEVEESKEKGSDFAEVSEIREYVPGDRIRDIHWKLSAKQEKLMVKERIAMAGSEMVILLKIASREQETEAVLKKAYNLCQGFLNEKIPFRILCWNQTKFSFEEYHCSKMSEVMEAFCEMFRCPVSFRESENQEVYMKNCYPYVCRYLTVWSQDGEVQLEIQEND